MVSKPLYLHSTESDIAIAVREGDCTGKKNVILQGEVVSWSHLIYMN